MSCCGIDERAAGYAEIIGGSVQHHKFVMAFFVAGCVIFFVIVLVGIIILCWDNHI